MKNNLGIIMLIAAILVITIVASCFQSFYPVKLTLLAPDGKVYKTYYTKRSALHIDEETNTIRFYNENGNYVQYRGAYIMEYVKDSEKHE